jgi:hypothetical protein
MEFTKNDKTLAVAALGRLCLGSRYEAGALSDLSQSGSHLDAEKAFGKGVGLIGRVQFGIKSMASALSFSQVGKDVDTLKMADIELYKKINNAVKESFSQAPSSGAIQPGNTEARAFIKEFQASLFAEPRTGSANALQFDKAEKWSMLTAAKKILNVDGSDAETWRERTLEDYKQWSDKQYEKPRSDGRCRAISSLQRMAVSAVAKWGAVQTGFTAGFLGVSAAEAGAHTAIDGSARVRAGHWTKDRISKALNKEIAALFENPKEPYFYHSSAEDGLKEWIANPGGRARALNSTYRANLRVAYMEGLNSGNDSGFSGYCKSLGMTKWKSMVQEYLFTRRIDEIGPRLVIPLGDDELRAKQLKFFGEYACSFGYAVSHCIAKRIAHIEELASQGGTLSAASLPRYSALLNIKQEVIKDLHSNGYYKTDANVIGEVPELNLEEVQGRDLVDMLSLHVLPGSDVSSVTDKVRADLKNASAAVRDKVVSDCLKPQPFLKRFSWAMVGNAAAVLAAGFDEARRAIGMKGEQAVDLVQVKVVDGQVVNVDGSALDPEVAKHLDLKRIVATDTGYEVPRPYHLLNKYMIEQLADTFGKVTKINETFGDKAAEVLHTALVKGPVSWFRENIANHFVAGSGTGIWESIHSTTAYLNAVSDSLSQDFARGVHELLSHSGAHIDRWKEVINSAHGIKGQNILSFGSAKDTPLDMVFRNTVDVVRDNGQHAISSFSNPASEAVGISPENLELPLKSATGVYDFFAGIQVPRIGFTGTAWAGELAGWLTTTSQVISALWSPQFKRKDGEASVLRRPIKESSAQQPDASNQTPEAAAGELESDENN